MKKLLLIIVFVFTFAAGSRGQTTAATPSSADGLEAREERLLAEIKILEAQIKLLNTIRSAAGSSDITAATSGGATNFATAAQPNLETVSLSYEAVQEISRTIDRELKPIVSQYRGLVIYHEPDFLALARYRFYREQVRLALANYESIVKRIEDEAKTTEGNAALKNTIQPRSVRGMGSEALVTALGAPGIATAAVKSVAELLSLFRTDTTITQSRDVVDRDSLGAVVAGTFLKANPNLVVYYPEQFVPEYEIGSSDENSIYSQLSRINAAEAYLNYFLDEVEDLSPARRDQLGRIIAAAKVVQTQIHDLGFSTPTERGSEQSAQASARVSEFRQMMRAEKLDRMLNPGAGAKVGVIKIRLLASGGARREKRNLLLGGKTDYSGSAVVEVALYDADGTMRASEVFSYHTGFRKFKTNGKQPRL
ncbi:MAG: hypothetical protein ABI857_00640 [Acidobacteriota bacterium]